MGTLELAACGKAASALAWWADAGVDWDIADASCDWLAPVSPLPAQRSGLPRPGSASSDPAQAEALARAADSPAALAAAHRELLGARALFLEGDPASGLILAISAPAPLDHAQGALLGGDAGLLLSAMLKSIGRTRETVCLVTLAPWPSAPPALAAMTQTFVRRLLDLSAPKAVVALGTDATTALTGARTGVGRLRGRFMAVRGLDRDHRLLPTFHPGLLVAQPAQKAAAWADLLHVKAQLSA